MHLGTLDWHFCCFSIKLFNMAHQTSGSFHIVSQGTAQIRPRILSDSFPAGNSLEET